jgi:hypothetical protein
LESSRAIRPATVAHLPELEISLDTIQEILRRYLAEDDVFQDSFMEGGYLIAQTPNPNSSEPSLSKDAEKYMSLRPLFL